MGYRSEIAAVFYTMKVEDLPVVKLWLQENFPVKEFDDNIRWFDRGMVLECEYVKWYDSFPDVKAFNETAQAFIDLFCQGEDGTIECAYEFMRIGEEYEDIEVIREGSYDCFLECNRSIAISV